MGGAVSSTGAAVGLLLALRGFTFASGKYAPASIAMSTIPVIAAISGWKYTGRILAEKNRITLEANKKMLEQHENTMLKIRQDIIELNTHNMKMHSESNSIIKEIEKRVSQQQESNSTKNYMLHYPLENGEDSWNIFLLIIITNSLHHTI